MRMAPAMASAPICLCMKGRSGMSKTGTEKLLAGMILSNEPGYYKRGSYGIRLENLIIVTPAEELPDGDIAMHGFETLTLAPFDKRLLEPSLLTRDELHWLDEYHARVLARDRADGRRRDAGLAGEGDRAAAARREMRSWRRSADELPSAISTDRRRPGTSPACRRAATTRPATTSASNSAGPAETAAGATSVVSTAAGTAFSPASTRGWMCSKRDSTRWPPTRVRIGQHRAPEDDPKRGAHGRRSSSLRPRLSSSGRG